MQISRNMVLSASALALAVASPLAFSQDQGVTTNDACAQTGTCCGASNTCVVNGAAIGSGYWQSGSGACES